MGNRDVSKLAQALHDAGAMNLETKVSDILKIRDVGDFDTESPVAATAVAWDSYVMIIKGPPDDEKVADQILRRADVSRTDVAGRLSHRE